jgi:hypothetical protein
MTSGTTPAVRIINLHGRDFEIAGRSYLSSIPLFGLGPTCVDIYLCRSVTRYYDIRDTNKQH